MLRSPDFMISIIYIINVQAKPNSALADLLSYHRSEPSILPIQIKTMHLTLKIEFIEDDLQ